MDTEFNINQVMNAGRFQDHLSLEKHFDYVAGLLLNRIILHVGENQYRFTEIEFYFFKSGIHEDPFIHKDKMQLETGQWYFHGSGLDITFGDGINHGGILIRGMSQLKCQEQKFINGPLRVINEIFKAFGNIAFEEKTFYLEETNELSPEEIIKSSRIGLGNKEQSEFRDKFYRYLTFPYDSSNKYSEKTLVAHAMSDGEKQFRQYSIDEINKGFKYKII
jgi:hypothetical protein